MQKFDKNFSHSMRNMSAYRSRNERAEKVKTFFASNEIVGLKNEFLRRFSSLCRCLASDVFHVSF